MQRGILIAYFMPFVVLIGLLISSIFQESNLIFVLISQLIWAPIVIIHCIISFFIRGRFQEPIPRQIIYSNTFLLVYVLLAIIAGESLLDASGAEFMFILVFSIIPWLMLLHFTYIQYLIYKTKGLEDESSDDLLDLDIE